MFTRQSDVKERGHAVQIFTRQSDVRKRGHVVPVFTRQSDVRTRGHRQKSGPKTTRLLRILDLIVACIKTRTRFIRRHFVMTDVITKWRCNGCYTIAT